MPSLLLNCASAGLCYQRPHHDSYKRLRGQPVSVLMVQGGWLFFAVGLAKRTASRHRVREIGLAVSRKRELRIVQRALRIENFEIRGIARAIALCRKTQRIVCALYTLAQILLGFRSKTYIRQRVCDFAERGLRCFLVR